MGERRIVVIGGVGGTNVGEGLRRAGPSLDAEIDLIDQAEAMHGPSVLRHLAWHGIGRRPPRLHRFSRHVVERAVELSASTVIGTGAAYLARWAVDDLRARGIRCLNYSTDDPWNPAHYARWQQKALPGYDIVFTPRRANIDDFRRIGCMDVRHLPFAYDEQIFNQGPAQPAEGRCDGKALFVGGADRDRAAFFQEFSRSGGDVTLVGGYWDRFAATRRFSLGPLPPARLAEMTRSAAVNICLVRRANRDGHVMRSFEIPAVGGFMIAEDTEDHRELFGAEGEAVLYFQTPADAASKTHWAISHPAERVRMAAKAHTRITRGGHTYRDRLKAMIESGQA